MNFFKKIFGSKKQGTPTDKNIEKAKPELGVGKVLVSLPQDYADPTFEKKVVLLFESNNVEGNVGLIINGKMINRLCDISKKYPHSTLPITFGGPVLSETGTYTIHTYKEQGRETHLIKDGLYFGCNLSELKDDLDKDVVKINQLRIFKGLSVWSPGQLEDEIKVWNSWAVMDIDIEDIMTENTEGLWDKLYSKIANEKVNNPDAAFFDVKKEREGYINVGKNIYPAVRKKDDPRIKIASNVNPVLTEDITDDLVVCYLLDKGESYEWVGENLLKQLGLEEEDVKKVAYRNLAMLVNKNCQVKVQDFRDKHPQTQPFFSIEFNGNFNPSMMILNEFWEQQAEKMTKSKIHAVSIPAKNIMYFTTLENIASFDTMAQVGEMMYNASIEDNLQLSKEVYVRKDGKWFLCDKSDEQIEQFLK